MSITQNFRVHDDHWQGSLAAARTSPWKILFHPRVVDEYFLWVKAGNGLDKQEI
jgi:hypothetical protein